jgi:hypothetical protein
MSFFGKANFFLKTLKSPDRNRSDRGDTEFMQSRGVNATLDIGRRRVALLSNIGQIGQWRRICSPPHTKNDRHRLVWVCRSKEART